MRVAAIALALVLVAATAIPAAADRGRGQSGHGSRSGHHRQGDHVGGHHRHGRPFHGHHHHRRGPVFLLPSTVFVGPPAYAAPPVVYAPPPVVYPPPPVYYAPPPVYAPAAAAYAPPPAPPVAPPAPPGPRVVEFSNGRYELRGDGLAVPYTWVWVPNPPTEPPVDTAPAARRPAAMVYRWTDERGVTTFTDDATKVPPQFRALEITPRP